MQTLTLTLALILAPTQILLKRKTDLRNTTKKVKQNTDQTDRLLPALFPPFSGPRGSQRSALQSQRDTVNLCDLQNKQQDAEFLSPDDNTLTDVAIEDRSATTCSDVVSEFRKDV